VCYVCPDQAYAKRYATFKATGKAYHLFDRTYLLNDMLFIS